MSRDNPVLCFVCCHSFAAEISAAVVAEGWTDVMVQAFPTNCGRPALSWDALRQLLPAACGQVVVFGRACLHDLGEPPAGFPPVRMARQGECFHLLAGQMLVDEAIAAGGYLVTASWLHDWPGKLRAMGFDPALGSEFFSDFAQELVLLDTGLDPLAPTQWAEFTAAVGLPSRRLAVGLDHLRLLLGRHVLEWRLSLLEKQQSERNRAHIAELADYVAAMDLLTRMAKTQTEADTIGTIEELFQMLFAPGALYYLRLENNIPLPGQEIPANILAKMRSLSADYIWTPNEDGFLLRISHGDIVLGVVAVDGLAFPAYRQRYLNMALAVSRVCGLAVANARNRRRLLEAEKMASLGILVAGVAHEINTPLGVSRATASTLAVKTSDLAEHFAAHTLTQSELSRYFDSTATGSALLQQNLERIGDLVDTFRQVAVEGKPLRTHHLRLRATLEAVIRSLGERIDPRRVTVEIHCDPLLEIEAVSADWASIFVNLLSNSLQHGFKGRATGRIEIRISADTQRLHAEYSDDGNGIGPDGLAHIFDPFFTTDLQNGSGLGMHLVYNLITQRMGGHIHCDSPPNAGIVFRFSVPLSLGQN